MGTCDDPNYQCRHSSEGVTMEVTHAEFGVVMQTHVHAARALIREVLPGMTERRHGNVIFFASTATFLCISGGSRIFDCEIRCLGMVRTLAEEVSMLGISANAIGPGMD
jgi:NAD(P)-dependent dehydrogenase (short-subunit alcohol dehydrogenase family)